MKKLAFAFALVLAAGSAEARSAYLTAFNTKYGTANTVLDDCNTCHDNGYKTDLAARLAAGDVIATALTAVEPLDSDRDGYTNLAEIKALTQPGDATSKPGTTVTSCVDADKDGFYVIAGSCALPAGAPTASDCNDANVAVYPGATELCSNGIDDNCNGLVDTAESTCPAPTGDYAVTGLGVTGTIALRKAASVYVDVALLTGTGTATLDVTATTTTSRGRTKTVVIAAAAVVGGTGRSSFSWKPSASGTWTIEARVSDATGGDTNDSATTTVVVP
jgi:hypothetical protein